MIGKGGRSRTCVRREGERGAQRDREREGRGHREVGREERVVRGEKGEKGQREPWEKA